MILRLGSGLLLAVALLAQPAVAQPAHRWNRAAPLEVRDTDRAGAKLMDKIPQGHRVTQLREVGSLCEIAYGPNRPQAKGWVSCDKLLPQPLPMADERWVKSGPLLVRAQGSAEAPVQARLQQGSRVKLVKAGPEDGYCEVAFGGPLGAWAESQAGFVACRFLNPTWVAPLRAGEAGVPAERRWAAGRAVLLRAAPQGEVLARLPLNTELNLRAPPAQTETYCAVQTQIPTQAPQDGFVACNLLARTPIALERIAVREWHRWEGVEDNPEYNPRQMFALEPSWEWLAHYEKQQGQFCEAAAGGDCPVRDADYVAERQRMLQALHGQLMVQREPAAPLKSLAELDGAEWGIQGSPDFPREGDAAAARLKAFLSALPLQSPAPSWFRSEHELAGPATPLNQLAERFDAQQRWYVGELLDTKWEGARVERLTKPVLRIELLSDGRVRASAQQPQTVRHEWRPEVDYMCQDWPGEGFAYGDLDAGTAKRNGWQAPPGGPRRLFWFHSSRMPAAAAKALGAAERVTLKREQHGFTRVDLRRFDLDGDGLPDLLWAEATGRGVGHLDGPPAHDDPWLRLLFVNLAGQWKLLSSDQISYGCGC
ncbi:hypothetical protein [Inhella sp.]|uniref:hypothetical protein n=1 Tax=Inhella sp. TaxID=1921806 RepID=UPI0035B36723